MEESLVGRLGFYYDLAADVRYSNSRVSIRQLVTPDDPQVKELAAILRGAPDPVQAAHRFVYQFAAYEHEPGDYWATAREVLERKAGDCDCKSILLCSILRNYFQALDVFCAFGTLDGSGHMWVVVEGEDGEDRILESTAPPEKPISGNYHPEAIFNDKYAFSTAEGLKDFELQPVKR